MIFRTLPPSLTHLSGRSARTVRCARGFTVVELLTVIGVIVLLLGVLIPVLAKARNAAKSARCLSNLRQIAVGFHIYADDNGGKLPDPAAAEASWETVMEKYLRQPGIFECPADEEIFGSIGTSYDWRDTGDPDTTLAGRPLSDAKASNVVLAFDSMPHWHAKGKMNVAWTDTSASAIDVQVALEDVMDGVKKEKKQANKNKGPGNNSGNGKGSGNNPGNGPGDNPGKGPGDNPGKGPGDNPNKGPGNNSGNGNGANNGG